jgi:hypothetical protein
MAALVASAAGDVAGADGHVIELERMTRDLPAWRSFCRVEPVRVALGLGRLDLAEAFVDDAQLASGWDVCAQSTAGAMLAEARGELTAAADSYRQAAASWHEYGSLVEQAYALLGRARCGDADAACQAEEIFCSLGARLVLARAA